MGAAFVRTSMQNCKPDSAGSYIDVDANDYGVPADATGVWVNVVRAVSYDTDWDVRKNGSTDTFGYYGWGLSTVSSRAFVGIDANGVFEAKVYHAARIDYIYMMGYMVSPVTMHTNATDVSTATTGSYVDVNVSGTCPNATMAMLSAICPDAQYGLYTRKNGSTDDRYSVSDAYESAARAQIVGLDGSQIFEQKIENAVVDLYVQGYYAGSKVTMHTNATDRSTATTGSYEDVAALAAGALVGFYEVVIGGLSGGYGLRKNGAAEDTYASTMRYHMRSGWIVECDANRVIEQKIESNVVDLWELGYAVVEGWAHTFNGVTSPAEVMGVPGANIGSVDGV